MNRKIVFYLSVNTTNCKYKLYWFCLSIGCLTPVSLTSLEFKDKKISYRQMRCVVIISISFWVSTSMQLNSAREVTEIIWFSSLFWKSEAYNKIIFSLFNFRYHLFLNLISWPISVGLYLAASGLILMRFFLNFWTWLHIFYSFLFLSMFIPRLVLLLTVRIGMHQPVSKNKPVLASVVNRCALHFYF